MNVYDIQNAFEENLQQKCVQKCILFLRHQTFVHVNYSDKLVLLECHHQSHY